MDTCPAPAASQQVTAIRIVTYFVPARTGKQTLKNMEVVIVIYMCLRNGTQTRLNISMYRKEDRRRKYLFSTKDHFNDSLYHITTKSYKQKLIFRSRYLDYLNLIVTLEEL